MRQERVLYAKNGTAESGKIKSPRPRLHGVVVLMIQGHVFVQVIGTSPPAPPLAYSDY